MATSRKAQVLFRTEPFESVFPHHGDETRVVTAFIFEEPHRCGVGLSFGNGTSMAYGIVDPRDLITAWRATEVLKRLASIKPSTLEAAYHAAQRNPSESDRERYVRPLVDQLGQDVYDAIMDLPVPEQIIRAILDNQSDDEDESLLAPDLWPITAEVRAGTIAWRSEFDEYDIQHPLGVDTDRLEHEAVLAPYEPYLLQLAQYRELSPGSLTMAMIRNDLLQLHPTPYPHIFGPKLTVALAGVAAEVRLHSSIHRPSEDAGDGVAVRLTDMRESYLQTTLDEYAAWLTEPSSSEALGLKESRPNHALTINRRLLSEQLEVYFPDVAKTG